MQELVHNVSVQRAFASAQVTGDTNSSLVVDTQGYEAIMFVFLIAAVAAADGSNYLTVKVEESDDNTFAAGVTVVTDDSARIIGTQLVINATTQASSAAKFGVSKGTKRYMRLVLDETGTFDGTFGALAICSGARHKPVS